MNIEVQDGRHLNHKPAHLNRSEESNNILTQALETNDMDLLDWCVENNDPPVDISSEHLAHLLHFLSGRYWVFSNPLCLNWIEVLLKRFYQRMRGVELFRPVLEDIKGKLTAKTRGFQKLGRLRDGLAVVNCGENERRFTVDCEAQMVLDEDD